MPNISKKHPEKSPSSFRNAGHHQEEANEFDEDLVTGPNQHIRPHESPIPIGGAREASLGTKNDNIRQTVNLQTSQFRQQRSHVIDQPNHSGLSAPQSQVISPGQQCTLYVFIYLPSRKSPAGAPTPIPLLVPQREWV